jgi:hypothetical protein
MPEGDVRSESRLRSSVIDIAFAIVAPVIVTATIYLAPFVDDPTKMPSGFDVSGYMWNLNVVHDFGIPTLRDLAPEGSVLAQRPGYPIALSILRSTTGSSSLTIMWIAPAIFAAAIGLAAGSLASDGALEKRRRSVVVAIAVAGSAFVVWTAVGYATNLAFDVIAVACAVVALRVARGERGILAGAILLAGGALLHWMFAVLFAGLLAAFALASYVLPVVRNDPVARKTPQRIGAMVAAAAVLGLVGTVLASAYPSGLPRIGGGPGSAAFVAARLPSMALPVTVPLALVGGWIVATGRRRAGHQAALLLALWASLAVVGPATWYWLNLPLPPYRWAAFALGIPALISLGVLGIWTNLTQRPSWVREIAGAGLAAIAVFGLVAPGAAVWWSRHPRLTAEELAQTGTLSSYLANVPEHSPIIVIIGPRKRPDPVAGRIRGGLPATRVPDVRVVPARVDLDAPDLGLGPGILGPDPARAVVVELEAYRRGSADGRRLGPGVWLLAGPEPGDVRPATPPRAPSVLAFAGLTAAALATFAVAGVGWAMGLTELALLGCLALAPAFGLATLGPIGLVASRLGIPLHGAGGWSVLAVTALLGAASAAISHRTRTGFQSPFSRLIRR